MVTVIEFTTAMVSVNKVLYDIDTYKSRYLYF